MGKATSPSRRNCRPNKIAGEPVSRVLSRDRYRFRPACAAAAIHLTRRIAPTAPATNPDLMGAKRSCLRRGARPLCGLAPGGVCHDGNRYRSPGAPLPHPFTLACAARQPSAVCSLWHFPCGCPRRALPATLVSWSPDFPRDPKATRLPGSPAISDIGVRNAVGKSVIQRVWPRSRSSRSWNRIARTSPSITPSIRSGRQRRWKASTALRPSVMS